MSDAITRKTLIARLDAIGRAVAARPDGLALLGLGSCAEVERLDAHSDLDFFVIVADGAKGAWVERLDWLADAAPIGFAHRNTVDGWKTLSADGVLCEFAVFEPDELRAIPFAPGRVIWAREGFETARLRPVRGADPVDRAWRADEALTDLMIGLMRAARGETAAAWQSICVHAASNALAALATAGPGRDPFDPHRRLERTDPTLAARAAVWRGPDLNAAAADMVDALGAEFGANAATGWIQRRLAEVAIERAR